MSDATKTTPSSRPRRGRNLLVATLGLAALGEPLGRRKLLAATIGLAAVSMIGAGCSSGNLVSPDAGGALRDPPQDSGQNDDGGTSR
jgi:hypothetical protein